MKRLGLEYSCSFLLLKNELKLFQSKEKHEKGGPAPQRAVSKPHEHYITKISIHSILKISLQSLKSAFNHPPQGANLTRPWRFYFCQFRFTELTALGTAAGLLAHDLAACILPIGICDPH